MKFTIEYFRKQGVPIFDKVPDGYKRLDGATTQPKGYNWYFNGEPRFSGKYKHCLVKEEQ